MNNTPEQYYTPTTYTGSPGMYTAIDRFLFGLCFGMGFAVANAVLAFIVSLLQGGVHH
jgi:hypothetical protein